MQVDELGQLIEALRSGVATLLQRPEESLSPQALLKVVESELYQQNLELANTSMLLEAERQRYQELFEEAPDGYLVTDTSGVLQKANGAAATLLNVRQEFLVGKPLVIFIADKDRQAFYAYLTQLQQITRSGKRKYAYSPVTMSPLMLP